jgi:hypothetical protein
MTALQLAPCCTCKFTADCAKQLSETQSDRCGNSKDYENWEPTDQVMDAVAERILKESEEK